MRRIILGAVGAMAALAAGAPTPAATTQQASVATQRDGTRVPASTPVAGVSQQNIIQLMSGGFTRYAYGRPPIWAGIQKRGNRRGRSRFNYNR